jgi:hypothetical protein
VTLLKPTFMERITVDGVIHFIKKANTALNDLIYDKNLETLYYASTFDVDDINWIVVLTLKPSYTAQEVLYLVEKALYEKGCWHEDEVDDWIVDNFSQ